MILCPSCNARNANRSTFCIRCGNALATAAERDPGGHTDAFAIAPEQTPAGLIDTAAMHLAEGRTQAAIANCRRAIALSPGEVEAHAILGMAYEQQGDLAAALEAYEAVVALAPQRNAERQKAALLRLRLGEHPEVHTRPQRPAGPVLNLNLGPWFEHVKARVATNPPLYAGLATGVFTFLILAAILVHAGRAQAQRTLQAQYTQEVQLGDEAYTNQQYAEAATHYAAAWKIRQGDTALQARWQQAHQLWTQQQNDPQLAIARMPKYIPNLTGRNPFDPVPIGGAGVPLPTGTPQQLAALPTPPPTTPPQRPPTPYETVREPARSLPNPTPQANSGFTGRRPLPSPFDNTRPISPVPDKNNKPAPNPNPAPVDNTPSKPRPEITIWTSDKPATRPAAPAPRNDNAESLRSRGEAAAREGRKDDAINYYSQAAEAFDRRAGQDPTSAALSRQNASSCRYSIEVLRNSH